LTRLAARQVTVACAEPVSQTAPVSDKLKALLHIAEQAQQGGRNVTDDVVARARDEGATDKEIHDTVLIAAAFCL
jgi:alkylhydroperoxidase/carboxymuconolactone decarboxylase family protein YurZ